MIDLQLLTFKNKIESKREGKKNFLKCVIRKRWIQITPEEMVRQMFLYYLTEKAQISSSRIAVERSIQVLDLQKRFDIVVFDRNGKAHIIVELKAPNQNLNQQVLDQISHYNIALEAPYLIVCNGIKTIAAFIDQDKSSIQFLDDLPNFK